MDDLEVYVGTNAEHIAWLETADRELGDADCSDTEEMYAVVDEVGEILRGVIAALKDDDKTAAEIAAAPPLVEPDDG